MPQTFCFKYWLMLFSDTAGPCCLLALTPVPRCSLWFPIFLSLKESKNLPLAKQLEQRPSRHWRFPLIFYSFVAHTKFYNDKNFLQLFYHVQAFFMEGISYFIGLHRFLTKKITLFIEFAVFPTGRCTAEGDHSLAALSTLPWRGGEG